MQENIEQKIQNLESDSDMTSSVNSSEQETEPTEKKDKEGYHIGYFAKKIKKKIKKSKEEKAEKKRAKSAAIEDDFTPAPEGEVVQEKKIPNYRPFLKLHHRIKKSKKEKKSPQNMIDESKYTFKSFKDDPK